MKVFATTIILSLSVLLQAQDLHYDIVRNGHQIGSLEITDEWDGPIQTYSMTNSVEFKVLFSFKVVYSLTESFEKGILKSGKGHNTLNDITQKETSIAQKADGSYSLIIDGVEAMGEKTPIYESMAKVYHQEPIKEKKYYSQYFGTYLTFEQLGDHEYSLKSPDGENIYKYDSGYCTEVKVIRDFATFYIKIKPEVLATLKSKSSAQQD